MMDHFNCTIENLGETLFGDDPSVEDFKTFVENLDEKEQTAFLTCVKEALLIEAE